MPNFELDKESYDSLDPAVQELYSARGDNYLLTGIPDAVGPLAYQKLKEEAGGHRTKANTNATALSELKSLLGEGTPEELRATLDQVAELKLAAEGKNEDFEKNLSQRVEARLTQATAPLQRKLELYEAAEGDMKSRLAAFEGQALKARILGDVAVFAEETGVIEAAYNTPTGAFNTLVLNSFEVVEGETVAKSGVPGVTAGMTPDIVIHELKKAHSYLWKSSRGGGANGGNGKGGDGPNIFKPGPNYNLTAQGRMRKENPELAAKFEKAAKNS